ncbi:MAG: glutamate racemase [Acidobacteria bacterium]|nr:glutamate racemase [Acidobacteriota bacterium]MBI3427703.1 glutamate racemase [Acidobacteriota bacterium]
MNPLPIGIFDSGVGGLTVLQAVRRRLPNENLIYLGDTARVPYGTKSRATVERYAVEDAAFLVEKGVKLIVVACNTASAMSRERLRREFDTLFLTVLGPGARAAARVTRNGRVGVIATEATIESGAYAQGIQEASGARPVEVFSQACPLFVSLVEEGEVDSAITRLVATKYLAPLRAQQIDTLVLGCTHYPLLKPVLAEVMGEGVTLVDSAEAVAVEVETLLSEKGLLNPQTEAGRNEFYVTDAAQRFHRIAAGILGAPLAHLEAVEVWGHDRLPTNIPAS